MKKQELYEETQQLQIDLFEVQQEWEWHQQKLEEDKSKQEKKETVIIIDI